MTMPPPAPNRVKAAAKWAAHMAALVAAVPFLVAYRLSAVLVGRDRALEGATQALAGLPGIPGVYVRRAFLTRTLARCARSAEVHYGTLFSQAGAEIGENVYVGPRCHLGLVRLDRDCLIAAGVHIPSGGRTHAFADPDAPIHAQGGRRDRVTVGAGAWVGSAAVVLADVGPGTVVGAGSVVTKPLPADVVAAGVPAKVLRPRFPNPPTE